MFDCIPRGTYFIPSDNAVRIIDYSTSLYNIPYIALLLYKFNESKINHFLLIFAKCELLGGRRNGVVKIC